MKAIKIVITSIVIFLIFFFTFYKSDKISIEGIWTPDEIILNGQPLLFPAEKDSLFIGRSANKIIINEWIDSLYISNGRDTIRAGFVIKKNSNGKHQIRLSSDENSLNENFVLEIDTLHLGPLVYQIHVKIESKKTLMRFQREVHLKLWEPELPKKGQI